MLLQTMGETISFIRHFEIKVTLSPLTFSLISYP